MRRNTKPCSEPSCSSRIFPRGQEGRTVPTPWCRRHEHEALQPYRDQLIEAMLERIEPDWDTGCWNWTGAIVQGYGRYYGAKSTVGTWIAHRLTWHLFQTGHEKHQEIDHRCNNPLCVSPLHLQAVSRSENNELRDQRRADPLHPWYPDDNPRAAAQNGWMFAMLKGLPWRNPVSNYSQAWEAHYRPPEPAPPEQPPTEAEAIRIVTKALKATWIRSKSLEGRTSSEIQSEQREALLKCGMKDRIITELQLTRDEAQSLLRPKRVKPRRSRGLTGSTTRTKAR